MRSQGLIPVAALLLTLAPACPAQDLRRCATFEGLSFPVRQAVLSPDGKLLAAGGGNARGGELKLWETAGGEEIASLPGFKDSLYCLAFSPDGKLLAAGGGAAVQVWDVASRKEVAAFDDHYATLVAFGPDGKRLAAGGQGVKVWDLASCKELASFAHHIAVYGAFNPDLTTLAAPNYQEIDLWDLATGKERATLSEHRGRVGCLAYSRDGKTLVAASYHERFVDGRFKYLGDLKLWDVAAGKERAAFQEHLGLVKGAALSPDGKTVALLDSRESEAQADLKLLDVGTGRQRVIHPDPEYEFLSVTFNAGGRLLLIGTSDKSMRLCEVLLPSEEGK